jgi:hypothetical protein
MVQVEGGLMAIEQPFVEYPTMGILCCLDRIQPTSEGSNNGYKLQEVVNFMNELLYNQVFGLFVEKQNSECYKVDLRIEQVNKEDKKFFVNLSDLLVEKGYANKYLSANKKRIGAELKREVRKELIKTAAPTDPDLSGLKKYAENEPKLEIKEKCQLRVTHIETLSEFYVQKKIAGQDDEARMLMAKIQYFYEKKVQSNRGLPLMESTILGRFRFFNL